jgi:hypothetical protein
MNYPEAESYSRKEVDVYEHYFDGDHFLLARSLCGLGSILMDEGRPSEAEPLLRRGVEMSLLLTGFEGRSAHTMRCLGGFLLDQGRVDSAQVWLERSLVAYRANNLGAPEIPEIEGALGICASMQGHKTEADSLLAACRRSIRPIGSAPLKRQTLRRLIRFCSQQRRREEVAYYQSVLDSIPR